MPTTGGVKLSSLLLTRWVSKLFSRGECATDALRIFGGEGMCRGSSRGKSGQDELLFGKEIVR